MKNIINNNFLLLANTKIWLFNSFLCKKKHCYWKPETGKQHVFWYFSRTKKLYILLNISINGNNTIAWFGKCALLNSHWVARRVFYLRSSTWNKLHAFYVNKSIVECRWMCARLWFFSNKTDVIPKFQLFLLPYDLRQTIMY